MKAAFALIAPALILAFPAHATGNESSEKKDKVVCKKDNVTGSRLGSVRICMTASEWEANKAAARKATEDKQRASQFNTPQGG